MAKKAKKRAPKKLVRRQYSRVERDRRMEKFLIWGVVALGVLVAGLLGYGVIVETVIEPHRLVARVGDAPITVADFQARVRLDRGQMRAQLDRLQSWQESVDPTDPNNESLLQYVQGNIRNLEQQLAATNVSAVGEQSLGQLIDDELVRQEATRRGIMVTPEELQREIETAFGYDRNPPTPAPTPTAAPLLNPSLVLTATPTPTPYPTPTPMTEEAFRQQYDDYVQQVRAWRVSEEQFRAWSFELPLLTQKLQEVMSADVPTETEQAKVSMLSVDSQEKADQLIARLDAGEDFRELMAQVQASQTITAQQSITGSQIITGTATELEWYPKSIMAQYFGAQLAEAAFSLAPGEYNHLPIVSDDGTRYFVIEVVGREVRELDSFVFQQLGQNVYQEWLDNARQTLVVRLPYDPEIVPQAP